MKLDLTIVNSLPEGRAKSILLKAMNLPIEIKEQLGVEDESNQSEVR